MTESLRAGQTSGQGHRPAQRPMAEGTQGEGGRAPGGTGPQANGHRDGRHARSVSSPGAFKEDMYPHTRIWGFEPPDLQENGPVV